MVTDPVTLILTAISAGYPYVLQVSDRLVTRGTDVYDPLANKSLLYYAKNALVAVSYTGLAYLDGVPTDQWIAEQLVGRSLRDRGTMGYYDIQPLEIGQAMNLLCDRLSRVFSNIRSPTFPTNIVVAGWKWKRGRSLPLLATIRQVSTSGDFVVEYLLSRYWLYERAPDGSHRLCLAAAPPTNIHRAELQCAMGRLKSGTPESFAQALASTIRRVSTRLSVVGPHCMSIFLPPPTQDSVRIRFLPLTVHSVATHYSEQTEILPVAYSPWIIGHRLVVSPAIMAGGETLVDLGPIRVSLMSPTLAGGDTTYIMFTQRRRLPPR
jgi:hypothetical protein